LPFYKLETSDFFPSYYDKPDYDFLAKCLKQVMSKNVMKMEDPYDWELNYENLTKTKTLNQISGSKRTDTMAVRDKG